MEYELSNNRGYEWRKYENIAIRGEAFCSTTKDKILDEDIYNMSKKAKSLDEYCSWLKKIDGHFSIVIDDATKLYLIVDRLRTMPLFYSTYPEIYISDQTTNFEKSNHPFNDLNGEQFLATGYVIGKKTTLTDVYQVEAGQVISIDKATCEVEVDDYFLYRSSGLSTKDEDTLIADLVPLYTKVFSKLISNLDGRTAVVPLSGGYDSRLVIHMLHSLNYKDVICFTYGEKDNWESHISKEVAKLYGYEWIFVEYTQSELFSLYNEGVNDYFTFSINHSSFGHTQDLLAVKKMHDLKLIPVDSAFIPGHSGDFVAGSHIPKDYSSIEPVRYLFNKHCTVWPVSSPDTIISQISQQLDSSDTNPEKIELWDWRERQAKYICNSVKVYEYFNYTWALPLWDKEIMDFWLKVPIEYKIDRELYYKFANKLHGEIKSNPKRSLILKIKDRYFDVWYGRFFSNSRFYLFKKLNTIFEKNELPTYIPEDKRVLNVKKVGLNTMKMWLCLKSKL